VQRWWNLSGKINSETMRRLNYELDGKHRPAREIARNFSEICRALTLVAWEAANGAWKDKPH
jgi:hypothetical protein